MQQIEAITLDAGNTLLHPYPSPGEIYAAAAAGYGLRLEPEWAEARFTNAWRACQNAANGLVYGTTHPEARAFWRCVLARVFADHAGAESVLDQLVAQLYETFATAASWRLCPELDRVLQSCRNGGVRVGLVSNWDLRLRGLLRDLGILDRFESVVISAERGVEKPAPGIFRLAVAELGAAPARTLHVGDSWVEDVVGALDSGMQAAWYNPGGEARPEKRETVREIADLGELTALLPAT
jgi:putative hydrolase of the HAD superfamily